MSGCNCEECGKVLPYGPDDHRRHTTVKGITINGVLCDDCFRSKIKNAHGTHAHKVVEEMGNYQFDNYRSGIDFASLAPALPTRWEKIKRWYKYRFDLESVLLASLLGIVVLSVVIFLGFVLYDCLNPGPTFTLRKDEWECSRTVEYRSTSYVMVGKIMTPISNQRTKCVEYKTKQE